MPTLIPHPTRIESAGSKPKVIEEYVGHVNTATAGVSVAHMRSPEGWEEPGQTPEFDEYTVVLRGTLRVQHKSGELDVAAGQAVIAHRGEWGSLLNSMRRRRRVHRSLPARLLARHGASRPLGPASLQRSM